MSTWYYYNESGEKIAVTGGQLKGLAKAGLITPDTIVENAEGKSAPARKVKGLTFAAITQPEPAQETESPLSNNENVASSNTTEDKFKTFDQPDDEPATVLEPGTLLANRYRLLQQIGRGGMGVVWSAEEKQAGRKVVLKFVPHDLKNFETAVAQLKESFKKIHELHHQHICPTYTLEEDNHLGYYLVMKWLNGETLDQYIERTAGRKQPLPFEETLRILRPVAGALDYAHTKRIIHRDIKPSNIFIVLDDKKTFRDVQVIDFGLASEIRSSLTRVSQVRFDTSGTRPYMAPEQWRGRKQSAATDQYALAVTAYELLAGHLPFDVGDLGMLRMAVMNDPPVPLQNMPYHVNAALLKALAKDGGERFECCTDFIEALGGAEFAVVKKTQVTPQKRIRQEQYKKRREEQKQAEQQRWYAGGCRSGSDRVFLKKHARSLYRAAAAILLIATIPFVVSMATTSWKNARIRQAARQAAADWVEQQNREKRWGASIRYVGYTDSVNSAAFSPDGKKIVMGSNDKTARVLKVESTNVLTRLNVLQRLVGHQDSVNSAAFSSDGKKIVTSSNDKTARIWDAESGKALLKLEGHTDSVNSAAFSPDGKKIVTVSDDKTARIWDAESGRELGRLGGHNGSANVVALSPDGMRIVTCNSTETSIWDTKSGKKLLKLKEYTNNVSSAAFSPDGKKIVTGSGDSTARVWDARSGKELLTLGGRTGDVNSAAFSPDGKQIVMGCEDETVRIWILE